MSSTSASLENANKNNANNNNNNFTTSSSSIGQIINFKDFQPPPLSLLHKPPNSDNSNNNNNNSTDQQQQELELSDDLKKLFNVKVNLLGLAVPPALCKSALHNLNDYVLKFRKIKCVVTEPLLENKKIILLGLYGNPVGNDEMLIENQTQLISVLPPPVKTFIEENTTADAAADTTTTTIDSSSSTSTSENSKTNNNNNSITLISYPIQITYENWTSEEILKSLLPVEAPSGFELVSGRRREKVILYYIFFG